MQADGTILSHTYKKNGLLEQTILPDQTRVVYAYDLFERMTSKTTCAADGSILEQETWKYNSLHLLSYTDPRGLTTFYSYDGAGRKISETAEGRQKLYQYDALGFIEATTEGGVKHIQIHDVQGRVEQEWTEDELGIKENWMQFFYNASNRKEKAVRLTSQGESVDFFFYDGEGRLIRHVDPIGEVTEWRYSEVQNSIGQMVLQKTTIDPKGNMTVETYDALNHLASVEKRSPEGKTVAQDLFYYDASGNRIKRVSTIYQLENPIKTLATSWEYDPMGRMIKEVEPDQRTTRYHYDDRGRVSETTLPSGIVLSYVYDGIGRLLELTSSDGSIHYRHFYEQGPDPAIIIDDVHQLQIQRAYNRFGEIVHEISPHGLEYRWEYDYHGRCKRFELPNRAFIDYGYSGAHLVSVSKHSSSGELVYTHHYTRFDPNGHIQEEVLINNLGTITTQRDLFERPIRQSSTFLNHTVSYDPSGLVDQTDNSLFGIKNYSYDSLNQIRKEAEKEYAFDSFGNPMDCKVNDGNQIVSTDDSTLEYDLDGNPIERVSPEGKTEYSYDALGRLTKLTTQERKVRYCYDPFSRLVSKEVEDRQLGPSKILYLYNQESEIGISSEQGQILQLKVLGLGIQSDIGAAVAIELAGSVYCPLHDFNGNIIALLSIEGNVVETYDMDAFGNERAAAVHSPWRFCSKRSEEGLVFFGRRFYDPSLGRWLTPDPAGSIDSPNLYLYVRNSPLNRLDLFGLYSATMPWSNRPDDPPNIEVSIAEIESKLNGDAVTCRGIIGGVEVDLVVSCKHWHELQFNAEELETGNVNIFNHLQELVPKEGSIIGLITIQNGINVKKGEFVPMVEAVSKQINEGTLIIGLYNPSQGFPKDLIRAGKELLTIETQIVDLTRQLMTAVADVLYNVNPDGLWLHICHSEAGVILKNGLEGMTEHQRKNMQRSFLCAALGPAAAISSENVLKAVNYYSDKDNVTKRSAGVYQKDPNYDIQILKCMTPSKDLEPWIGDHAFLNDTYQRGLKISVDQARGAYGLYDAR